MANILSLALKINTDASGLKLDPVQKALRALGEETDKVSGIFDKFTATSEAAAKAQADTEKALNDLIAARKAGTVSADEFVQSFREVEAAAKSQAEQFARGAEITKQYASEESRRAEAIAELDALLQARAISEETYAKAVAEASGATAAAAQADREREALMSEGARLAEQFATAEEKRSAQLQRVQDLLEQGAISEETAARARAQLSGEAEAAAAAEKNFADQKAAAAKIIEANLSSVERAQKAYDAAVQQAQELEKKGLLTKEQLSAEIARQSQILDKATGVTKENADATGKQALKFNELAGVFAALPGPIGNVAGRISGLASAGEGLERVFSGGLSAGLSGIGASVTALINPFTLAVAGIAGFGAAATAVVSGLTQLDERVEKLGNTADKLGTSFEFVQVLDEAARRSGTSIDSVSAAFGRLQKNITGVDEESKAAQKALDSIGVTADELRTLAPEEQYRLIGERLQAIEDPAQRSAAATALFGKSGTELLPFFNNLGPAAQDLARFSATISTIDRGRIDDVGDGFDQLFLSLRGLGQNLLLPFAGLVEGVTEVFASIIGEITRSFIKPFGERITPVLDAVGEGFSAFAETVSGSVSAATESLQGIGSVFQGIFDTLSNVVAAAAPGIQSAFEAVTDTVTSLGKVFADSFGAIFDALGQFGASVAELLGYGNDVTQIGTAIGDAFSVVYSIFGQVVTAIGSVIEVLTRFATIIGTAVVKAAATVTSLLSQFLEFTGLGSALQAIGSVIGSVFGSIASVFGTIASAIGGTVGRLLTLAEEFLGIDRSAQSASVATEQLADASTQAADSADQLSESQKRAADEANRRAEEAQKIADAEIKRVNELLDLQTPIDKLAQDITATNNEIVRTEAALADARAAGATEEANRLASRLAQLDQLQQSLIDRSDEAAQGFADGFDKAFADVDKGIGGLIDKAADFGNEGAIAASQLTEGIEAAKDAVRDGILNQEAFQKEIDRQKKLFEERVSDLREAAKITERLYDKESELLDKQFEIEKRRAEELAAIRTGSIQIRDIREGGAGTLFDTLREDPAVTEAKKSRAELEKIRKEISELNAQRVDILAGTG